MLSTEKVREDVEQLAPPALRARIRRGEFSGGTAGLVRGFAQGNLVILPASLAFEFMAYCHANPKPCPLLAVSQPGEPLLPELGDVDIRTDVPKYLVYRSGSLAEEVGDISPVWRPDLVAFILGCSLTFEARLLLEGIPVRHVEHERVVPMYRTNIQTRTVGPFGGELVVSMRPMRPADAIRAVEITSLLPESHGAPVHLSEPDEIGIADLMTPDWGDPPDIRPGELPVFWACGVTPQVAIERAKPEICITHKPGHMLVTDLPCRLEGVA
jgi:uncharacterized protein YcsI (UPF0317 family)